MHGLPDVPCREPHATWSIEASDRSSEQTAACITPLPPPDGLRWPLAYDGQLRILRIVESNPLDGVTTLADAVRAKR